MSKTVTIIDAQAEHIAAICKIYNQALTDRIATFETEPRSKQDVTSWLAGEIPIKIAMLNGQVAGFAKVSDYRDRACYAGIKEYSVYVDQNFQRLGVGRQLMAALISQCAQAGLWKLVARIFPENIASLELAKQAGFRIVGTYKNHGRLDGVWKDCVIVELAL